MKRNSIIDSELKAGRSVEFITRRLYSVEPPISLLDSREKLFDILEMCSSGLGISILDIKIAGSGQSGYSFHKQKPFVLGESDLDLAVISRDFFERLLQGV